MVAVVKVKEISFELFRGWVMYSKQAASHHLQSKEEA